ncbi:iron-containing alcohol dehydrogenase [Clostridium lacusfryxellense]|uniref:iron-containing alcohol dehydrogenase n=1 Tax=Clostridium lacusfryxellense TaxID=205328 RepID=UPI001C0CA93E|nr:iron-containing alcohol dehydrogenase [Clostridium lacusfryxellense]MBU3113974.1 iron-containing alcohol dehydrogenase [Clostridium lacusfryxellense]
MDNFTFQNTTKIIFGKGSENNVGQEVSKYSKKILLHYGGGTIKKTGLYDRVVTSLKDAGVDFIELGGVKPNPRLSLVQEGIKICRENSIGFILAIGGGSVIDSSKAISIGSLYSGDVWDFYLGKSEITAALPIGTILTIPAAGSESSTGSVITNEDGFYKRAVNSELIYPKFSILNPELAFTLPKYQVACGSADIMAHLMERYFTNSEHVELMDRLIEATLKTVINNVTQVLDKPDNYDAWAEIMWSGTVAHNNLLNTGRVGDWGSHDIEHELSGIYDVAHGAGLAVIFPAWMKYVYKHDINRFAQFAVRVFNVENSFWSPEKTAIEGIKRLENFFKSLGLPTNLKELGIIDDRLDEMASKATNSDLSTVGNFIKLGKSDVYSILKLAK